MGLGLFGTSGTSRDSRRGSDGRAVRPSFRPTLDTLEDRTVPAVLPLVNLPLDVGPISVLTTTVDGQTVQKLTADVFIRGQDVGDLVLNAADVTTTLVDDVPVLNLHLEPISLNLLGLHVDTSAICLDVTATPGAGILGDLLGGLGGGLDLGGILGQLSSVTGGVNTVLGGLEHLLDGVLGQAMKVTDVLGTPATGAVVAGQQHDDFCDILNLSLGPIDLSLLGLNVALDNCDNGPVTVDVTADPNGGLLGGLLCGLADGNLTGQLINRVVGRLDRLIDRLGDLADQLGDIAHLPDRFERVADRLVDQLERFASKADSLADLDRLITRIDKTVNRLNRLIENTDIPAPVMTRLETLVTQLTRIVSRFRDLGFVNNLSLPFERAIDLIMARL